MELGRIQTHTKILVIDDDHEMLVIMGSLLGRMGYHVSEAATLAQARATLKAEEVDIVLCDAHLDGELGHDLLRTPDDLRGIPFVMMTGCLDEALREQALLLGASGFLLKPFRIQELSETLLTSLKAAQKHL